MKLASKLVLSLVALAATGAVALAARAGDGGDADKKKVPAWAILRPDAPKEPEGAVYSWKEPEGWAPPTLEELETREKWEGGRVADALEIGRERAKKTPPLCSAAEAAKLANDSDAANAKIASVMCQAPASPDEVDWDATINRHSASPSTLNPLFSSSTYETWMNGLHAAGLFSFDHELKHFADAEAVKRWRRSKTVDWVEMRDDMTWEDGTPFSAYDIEFSYHVIMDPNVPVPAQRTGVESLRWVKAYGPTTIVYFHKEPLVTNISNVNFTIIPKHIYQRSLVDDASMKKSEWHAYWNRNPLSGGGYVLKEWKTSEHVTFERRESSYMHGGKQVRSKPYFKQVRFRIIDDPNAALLALKKGELDEMILTARQWTQQTTDDDFYRLTTKVRGPEWSYSQVVWGINPVPDRPFFKDKRVRKALALALDTDELLKKVYFGLYQPCTGPFHPDSPWGTPDVKPLKQDLDAAEKLLDEAGWKVGPEGIRTNAEGVKFEFTINVPTGGTGDKVAELLKQNLKDLGIALNIKMLEWATYQQLSQEHKFEAGVAAWGTGADPDSAKNIWMSDMYKEGRNYGGYANPRVDELFDKGQREFDFEKRRKIYQEINSILFEDQPYLFLLHRATFWAFSKELRGYNFSPRGVFSYGPGFSSLWRPKKKAS